MQSHRFGAALFSAHIKRAGAAWPFISQVGSIGDNRLGGWYSYRASKATLNILIKTAAIEIQRSRPQQTVLALHPGTDAITFITTISRRRKAYPPNRGGTMAVITQKASGKRWFL